MAAVTAAAAVAVLAACTGDNPAPEPTLAAGSPASTGTTAFAQPAGRTCGEIAQGLATATAIPWQQRADTVADDGAVAAPGLRQCELAAGADRLTVSLYRPDLEADAPEDLLTKAVERSGVCDTNLPDPPDGTGLATSCVTDTVDTRTATTTLVIESGFVVVLVSAPKATTGAGAKVQQTSQQAAIEALDMI